MSNTHMLARFQRIITGTMLLSGLTVLALAAHSPLFAQTTSQGSSLRSLPTSEEARYEAAADLHPPVPVSNRWTERAFIAIGMILMIIGLAVHATLILRRERPVPVTDISGHEDAKPSRLRRNIDIIWIERKFRV